jgi:hypothetical protein
MGMNVPRDGEDVNTALRYRSNEARTWHSLLLRDYDALRRLECAKVGARDAGQVQRSFARRLRESASTEIGRGTAVSQYTDSRINQ